MIWVVDYGTLEHGFGDSYIIKQIHYLLIVWYLMLYSQYFGQ